MNEVETEPDKLPEVSLENYLGTVISQLGQQFNTLQGRIRARYVRINNTIIPVTNVTGIYSDEINDKYNIKFTCIFDKSYTFTWDDKTKRDSEFEDLWKWLYNDIAPAIILDGANL